MAELDHVLICGGTTQEWISSGPKVWSTQLASLVKSVQGQGLRWLTVCPYSGTMTTTERAAVFVDVIAASGGDLHHDKVSYIAAEGLMVIVDPCADGRERLVAAVARIAHDIFDEEMLAAAVLAPAQTDPDLVVVLGKPNKLPQSLVWELAYSELVFLDVKWRSFNVEHLQMAIDDFERRDRRYGGIDS